MAAVLQPPPSDQFGAKARRVSVAEPAGSGPVTTGYTTGRSAPASRNASRRARASCGVSAQADPADQRLGHILGTTGREGGSGRARLFAQPHRRELPRVGGERRVLADRGLQRAERRGLVGTQAGADVRGDRDPGRIATGRLGALPHLGARRRDALWEAAVQQDPVGDLSGQPDGPGTEGRDPDRDRAARGRARAAASARRSRPSRLRRAAAVPRSARGVGRGIRPPPRRSPTPG